MSFHTIDPGGLLPDLEVDIDVTNNPTNPVRVWTDITTYVRQVSFARSGRSDELQRTTTGTLAVTLDNRGDVITALGIRKAQWLRVQARWAGVTYARWQGIIESVPRQWPQAGKDATIQIQAADVLKIFALFDLAGQTFSAQRNDQRVTAIAALTSVPTGSIDTGTDAADAIGTPISEGTDSLSYLLEVEGSENGLLVADPAGTLSFQGRHWRMLNSAVPVATIGDTFGIPYRDSATFEDDDTRIANNVSVTPLGGTAVVVSDSTSQNKYWIRRLNRGLVTSDTNIAADAANYLLSRYKDPTPRIPTVTIDLAAVPSALKPTLFAANNSTRFTWKRNATTPISVDTYVEQISETIRPGGGGWQMTLQLSPAADESAWLLGDSVFGVLDTTTKLTY